MDSAGERFAAIQEALADWKNILTVKGLCELAGVSRPAITTGGVPNEPGKRGSRGTGQILSGF